jgi:hypothetical protein
MADDIFKEIVELAKAAAQLSKLIPKWSSKPRDSSKPNDPKEKEPLLILAADVLRMADVILKVSEALNLANSTLGKTVGEHTENFKRISEQQERDKNAFAALLKVDEALAKRLDQLESRKPNTRRPRKKR